MRRFTPPCLLALLAFLVCTAALVAPAQAQKHQVKMIDLHNEFSAFEDQERYDFVGEYEYSVIGVEEFDAVFFGTAVLSGRLHQLKETLSRYREGQLTISDDSPFLWAMVADATESLPGLVDQAQALWEQAKSLNPRRVGIWKAPQALVATNQARKNLATVLDFRSEVETVLSDYQKLQEEMLQLGVNNDGEDG